MTTGERPDAGTEALNRVVRRSRAAMALERVVRGFWPAFSLGCVVWAAAAFGLAEIASRAQLLALLGLVAAAGGWLIYRGIRRFSWPSRAQARARLDVDLPGRPLAALDDTPALGREDPAARAVWDAHLLRMRRLAAAARPARADLRLASRDPWALRLMALVLLIAAGLFARGDGVASVTAALAPAGGSDVAEGPSFEGWAEPPAYTGRPTLYLPELPSDQPVAVPQGTRITLRVYGAAERFGLSQTVAEDEAAMTEAAPGIATAAFAVMRGGSVTLRDDAAEVGQWSFTMEPDQPPQIELAAPLERAPTGETRLSYAARDDYGVAGARGVIALDPSRVDRSHGLAADPVVRPDLTVDLPLPMTGGGRELAETLVEDFSKHPFAGLPVTLRLTAEDGLGQTGSSEAIADVLPGRRFYDPLAAALVEQRRDLLWSPQNGRRVTQVLRALSHRPEEVYDSERAYLLTRIAVRRLSGATAGGAVAEVSEDVAEMLWQAALLLEDGSLGDAAERLAQARERLAQALRSDATDEEIAELMDELREATRDYMEQLAQEAIERGESQSAEAPPPGETMTQDQIQQLMDRIEELSEQGRRAEAEALLDMLAQLLENMEMQLAEGGQGQGGPGEQAMQGLADTLREQQGLADESFQQLQREFREGRPGEGQEPGQGQGQGQAEGQGGEGGDGPDSQSLAERQEALRELMEQVQRGLPGEAGEAAREALREAERNMGEARDGLSRGDTAEALDRQAEVIDNLREGMRQMSQDIREAQGGEGQPGAEEGQAQNGGPNDPLGRPLGSRGAIGTNESMLPEGDAAARARGILDEIRRRSGEQARPQLELDYLRRLLDRF